MLFGVAPDLSAVPGTEHTGGKVCFVGGAFGVGKSTLCKGMAMALGVRHVKASELLQFQPRLEDSTGKAAMDVHGNQAQLVEAIDALRETDEPILLDGHYCLLDASHAMVPVPIDIFRRINPVALVLVEAKAHDVVARLQKRDGRRFDQDLVEQLLIADKEHAQLVAKALGVPLFVADGSIHPGDLADKVRSVLGGTD